ncbi:MAG TPA: ATP-binding protein [Tepidisphaeraceae bacterium]|nr:ATP-binding protein [Tepidisphaeraceae bacterium]
MSTGPKYEGMGELAAAYQEYDRALRIRQARLGYLLGLLLIPTGWMLDYFVYPSLVRPHLEIRLWCSALLLPGFLILFTAWGQRHARLTDKGCTIIPMLAVCLMIYKSEGAMSPYYSGLNFTLVGACLVLPYTLREGAWFTIFVTVTYLAACVMHVIVRPADAVDRQSMVLFNGTLAANLYFVLGNGIICAAACHYRFIRRFEDFRLRHELDVNNKELASTLKKLKETEVQLVQSEKMNALGKLSAGLLHEINNPLNFTFMALQMAEQEADGNESLQDTLKDIGQGMTRVRGVISDLRTFAYPTSDSDREEFDIEDALTTALRLTAHELSGIKIDQAGVKHTRVSAGKTQVIHLFMNLLVNSAQASNKVKAQREPKIVIACRENGERVEVSLTDNGTGVKKEFLPRLFDPFFTTKDVGQGMGWGLSICHTIVKNHGGQIAIQSEEGQWTTVTFDLPAVTAAAFKTNPTAGGTSSAFKDTEEVAPGSIAA